MKRWPFKLSTNFLVFILLVVGLLARLVGSSYIAIGDEIKVIKPAIEVARHFFKLEVNSYYPYAFINFLALFFFIPANFCESCNYQFFLLYGRLISSVLSVLSGWLIFDILIKLNSSSKFSLIALIVYLCLPLSVIFGHYAFIENFLAVLLLGVFYYSIQIFLKAKKQDLLFGSLLAGISTATKYPGAITVVVILISFLGHYIFIKRKLSLVIFKSAVFIANASFLAFLLLSLPNFAHLRVTLNIIKDLQIRHGQGDLGFSSDNLLYNLVSSSTEYDIPVIYQSLLANLGLVISLIMIVGLILILLTSKFRLVGLFSFFLVSAYYLTINLTSQTKGIKYLIPVFPFVSIYIAYCLYYLLVGSKFIFRLLGIFLLLYTLFYSFNKIKLFNQVLNRPNAVTLAKKWVNKNVRPGAVIVQFASVPVVNPANDKYKIISWKNKYRHSISNSQEIAKDRAPSLNVFRKKYQADYLILNGRQFLKYYDQEVIRRYPETAASYQNLFSDLNSKTKLVKHWYFNEKNNNYNWPEIRIYKL